VDPALRGAGWYSDAGPLSEICRQVVVFGPGSIGQAHTAEEYMDLSSLRRASEVLGRFLERWATEGCA
jgi:acetylornithine deacetylase